jgi:hypothetical protein
MRPAGEPDIAAILILSYTLILLIQPYCGFLAEALDFRQIS